MLRALFIAALAVTTGTKAPVEPNVSSRVLQRPTGWLEGRRTFELGRPRWFTSEACALEMVPGGKPGDLSRFELTCDGEWRWTVELDLQLIEAVGRDGWFLAHGRAGPHEYRPMAHRDVVIVSIDAEHGIVELDRMERFLPQHSGASSELSPEIQRIVALGDSERAVVHAVQRECCPGQDELWEYQRGVLGRTRTIYPTVLLQDAAESTVVLAIEAVPRTPLVLIHWAETRFRNGSLLSRGARFALMDADGAFVWQLQWPDDDSSVERSRPAGWSWRSVAGVGRIRTARDSAEFELNSEVARTAKRFAVTWDEASLCWRVTEKAQD